MNLQQINEIFNPNHARVVIQKAEQRQIIDLRPEDVEDVTPITVTLLEDDYKRLSDYAEAAIKDLQNAWVKQSIDVGEIAGLPGTLELCGYKNENGFDVNNTTELKIYGKDREATHNFETEKLQKFMR